MQDMTKDKEIQRMTNPGLLLQRVSILALEALIPQNPLLCATDVASLLQRVI